MLRTRAGLTQRDVQARTGLGQVAVSRIERGEQLPSLTQVRPWVEAAEAPDDMAARVYALLDVAHNETRSWSEMGDGAHLQAIAAQREEDSRRIRDCSLTWLPGLCQTAEYARLLIPQVDPEESIDHAAAVAARVERQQVLYRTGRRFEFLIAEHVLLWAPGPGVMAGQREKLATIATLSDVEVRILPSSRVGAPTWHSFVLHDGADEESRFVSTELLHGGQWVSEVKTTALYEALWSRLWEASVSGSDAVALIRAAEG